MTGYSAAAGYNLLASSEKDGLTLITVILGATRDEATKEKYSYTDAIALMNWGYGNFKLAQLLTKTGAGDRGTGHALQHDRQRDTRRPGRLHGHHPGRLWSLPP